MSEPSFCLFANCIPVKGARRSLLCDLQSGRRKLIPNSLFDLLHEHNGKPATEIKAAYDGAYDEEIDEYLAFLVQNGWGFYTHTPERFPPIPLTYDVPSLITQAIIDCDRHSDHDLADLLGQLQDLGCKHIQIRYYDPIGLDALEGTLAITEGSRLQGLDIFLPMGPGLTDEERLRDLFQRYPRLMSLALTGADEDRRINVVEGMEDQGLLIYHSGIVDSPRCCGVVDRAFFQLNMPAFTESVNFNSCLNRKISVDTRGEIKNCPAMTRGFGNARETRLRDALFSEGFQAVWSVTKDQVNICRDCELRYICPDCRAHTEGGDPLGKPVSCGYDPYTATWGETRYPPFSV